MAALLMTTGCAVSDEEVTVLAAASLKDVCDELKHEYLAETGVTLNFSYGGSGALQAQIEEGAPADMFIPASTRQMDELSDEGLIENSENLLQNSVVLIVPKGNPSNITSFRDVTKAKLIGLGEKDSVPVGQYSEEIFTHLGIWEDVAAKANFGSDARTVLSWVETGAVDCGVVYKTDAMAGENIEIIEEAPADYHQPVIYPVGIIRDCENKDSAEVFMKFLHGDTAKKIFENHGFKVLQ